ncbi:MAG: TldD/PmbA family protein [Candidatus Diapherotrites archaeon]|nr:TldD/PmbA family protein [Candidatus Diapherotrites archaeon]
MMFEEILKSGNCEVYSSNVRVADANLDNDVNALRSTNESGYSIRVLENLKIGNASSNDFSVQSIRNTLETAKKLSGFGKEIPKNFSFCDTGKKSDAKQNFDNLLSTQLDECCSKLAEITLQKASDQNVKITNCSIKTIQVDFRVQNSLGIDKQEKGTFVVAAIDSKANTNKPLAELSSTFSSRILDEKEYEKWVSERFELTKLFVEPKKIESGKYPLLIEPGVFSPLIADTVGYWASGKSRVDKISFFEGKKNQQVFSEKLSITDDALFENAPSTSSIDMEGNPTRQTEIIKNGTFNSFFYDQLYASYFDEQATGNAKKQSGMGGEKIYSSSTFCGSNNLVVERGSHSIEELKQDFEGIIIEGAGLPMADSETGEFGFEIRNGLLSKNKELTPVRYGIFAGNVKAILNQISAFSKERDTVPDERTAEFNSSCVCPWAKLENQTIVGGK